MNYFIHFSLIYLTFIVDIVENDSEIKIKKINRSRINCTYCSKIFLSTVSLNKHITVDHPGNPVVAGDSEEKESEKTEGTEGSEVDSKDEAYSKSFKVLYSVLTDKKDNEEGCEDDKEEAKIKPKKENGGRLYSCDECERAFNHPSSLMYHKESVHNDGRRFICSKCGKSFTHKQLLQRHQMVHSDTRYVALFTLRCISKSVVRKWR